MNRATTIAAAMLAAAAVAAVSCRSGSRDEAPQASAAAPAARHVLLITIDTLRADRVGAYGHAASRTPSLDGLAGRGTRFTHAYATAPITLPSHATLMTGRYPPGHGARHNGMAMRHDVPTLASTLKRAGFATGAFVSAFPLDRRFGLAGGFDIYDDELPRGSDGRHLNERPGETTIDRALAWLRSRPVGQSIFMWVHLFEPHAPYGPPGSPGDALTRYDGEIAAADRAVGRLLSAWPDREATLVVATADHGESFGEHGEIGHSIFVYDSTLRVPLIVAGPNVPRALTVDAPVTLADLAPTIASLMQMKGLDADGVDLTPTMRGAAIGDRLLYAESFAPLLDFGWAPLRSVRQGAFKLIAAPRPELYEVAADPREERNVIAAREQTARELTSRVDRISSAELQTAADDGTPNTTPRPDGATADGEAVARLRALGYAAGGRAPGASRPDPKDRIAIASAMASVTSGELSGSKAEHALRRVLASDAANPQAHQRLAFLLADSGRCAEAERHFASAIAERVPSADPYLGLAMCQAGRGAVDAALGSLRGGRRAEPGNPVVEANIGLLELQRGDTTAAIAALRRAIELDADLHQARFALARALGRAGDRQGALREATTLLARLPASAPQRPEVERLVAALR